MGRLLKRKFIELEKAHNELAYSHEQALTFSQEIQTVNSEMGTLNRQLTDNITKLREAQAKIEKITVAADGTISSEPADLG
mgnify:CR=1 FL=1